MRPVWMLAQAQAVSLAGSQAFVVAAMALVAAGAGSAATFGALVGVSVAVEALCAPLAGGVVDRRARRDVLVVSDVACALAVGACALGLARAGSVSWAMLALAFVVIGAARAFLVPASRALVAELSPPDRLASANAVVGSTGEAALLAGQALAGFAASRLSIAALFAVDAASYAASALTELALPRRRRRGSGGTDGAGTARRVVRDVREAWNATATEPGLRAFLALVVTSELVAMPFVVVLPAYVTRAMGQGPQWFGYLLAAFGAGAIAGGVAGGRMRWRGNASGVTIAAAWAVVCAGVGALALDATPAAVSVALAVAGAGDGILRVGTLTRVQRAVPAAVHGRVFALVHGITAAAAPVALVAVGALVDRTGDVSRVPGLLALALAVLGTAAALSPRLRRFVCSA